MKRMMIMLGFVIGLAGIAAAWQLPFTRMALMMDGMTRPALDPYPPYTNLLACWYPLETDLIDASGNGIAAAWIGGGVPTFSGGGILMPGNRYVNVTNNWVYTNLNVQASFVIRAKQPTLQSASCWVYVRKTSVANSFNGGPNISGGQFLRLQTNNANRVLYSTGSSMPSNTTHTYAISFSGVTAAAYINGIQWASSVGWTNDALVPATDMRFGEVNTSFIPTNSIIYEILVYTNALSSNQQVEVHQWCDARD